MINRKWQRGEKAKLARALQVSLPYLIDVLARRKGVSPLTSELFEKLSKKVLGENFIPREAWVFNRSTTHWAFKR